MRRAVRSPVSRAMTAPRSSSVCRLPFISAAAPGLFGLESYGDLGKPRDLSKVFDTVEYAKWHSFRDSEDSRYVGLTVPSFLGRLPFNPKDGTTTAKDLILNAAIYNRTPSALLGRVLGAISAVMTNWRERSSCSRREAGRRALVGRAHDDQQEEHCHHHFRDERRHQRIAARRMFGIAVRREALGDVETGRGELRIIQNGRLGRLQAQRVGGRIDSSH